MRKKKSGFTLVEVMCAISIIASLALVAVPDIRAYVVKAKKLVVISQIHTAMKAIDTHNMFSTGSDYIDYTGKDYDIKILEAKERISDESLLSDKDITKVKKFGVCAAQLIIKDEEAINWIEIRENGEAFRYNSKHEMNWYDTDLKKKYHKYGWPNDFLNTD